jgi:hypothetical protein
MDQYSAAEALLGVAASAGPRTRSQSKTRDSSLSEPPPSPAPPLVYYGSRRRVHFEEEAEDDSREGPSTVTPRSTRGKAPVRLVDEQVLPESTSRRVTTKRHLSTTPPQPPSKRVSAGRKPLSNATNTLGKKRTTNTSKKTKVQALATQNRPAKPCANLAPTTRRSTTAVNKVTKPCRTIQTTKLKAPVARVSSNSIVRPIVAVASIAPVPIAFKLQFDSRWGHRKVSDDDTSLANTDKLWAETMKEMDETIVPWLEDQTIALFYPWKIRAILTSTGARGLRQNEVVTLAHLEEAYDRWQKVIDLIKHNSTAGMKDLSVTIESIWTANGREPLPEPPPTYEHTTSATTAATTTPRRRSERSQQHTASYFEERALFWDRVTQYWACPTPNRCEIAARRGLACFIHKGRHYEVLFDIAAAWRNSVRAEHGTLEQPSREIRHLIIRRHQQHVEELQKRHQTKQSSAQASPSNPATINHFYVNSQHQATEQVSVPAPTVVPTIRQVSPVPIELNTAVSWDSFWEGVKLAYPDWSGGFDRAKVALDQDYWNLRMLFNSSDKQLSRVVKQSGLRIVIHEELTKFVDNYKQSQRSSNQTSPQRRPSNPAPRHGVASVTSITSSSSSSPYDSSDGQI